MAKRRNSDKAKSLVPISAAIGLGLAAREMLARVREADLTGQVALVTGGSRGLGLAISRELAKEGCRLAICAREVDELDRAAQDLESSGAEVLALSGDVSVEAEVETMVARVLDHYGKIDLLFTVAGIIEVGELESLKTEDFRHAMDVMFWGTYYPVLAVLPGMRAQHYGRIAMIASIGGKISVPHLLPYSSAKFAAVGFSEGLAAEVARDGIQVTTVVPGLMRTGSHLNAEFKGNPAQQTKEYTWFSLGATSPLVPPADRAARIILRAVKRGEAECIFTFPFALASRFHGLAPATTIRLMQLANALLPHEDTERAGQAKERGMIIRERTGSELLSAATTLGDAAADHFNEKPGPIHTSEA